MIILGLERNIWQEIYELTELHNEEWEDLKRILIQAKVLEGKGI